MFVGHIKSTWSLVIICYPYKENSNDTVVQIMGQSIRNLCEGTNSRFRWTKYSDLYETVHLSLVLISMCLLTGALIFPCVIMMIFLFLLLKWGSPFHISPVASLGLLLYNLWQSNKLDWTQLNVGKVYWRERGTISKKILPKDNCL